MGHYFGWAEVGGALFWIDWGEWCIILGGWGWVHCLIMPVYNTFRKSIEVFSVK